MYDIDLNLVIGQLLKRCHDSAYGTLYVCLDDQVQFLDLAFLDLAEEFFQRCAGVPCQNLLSYLLLSLVSDFFRLA
jgi:hypothetical protein